MKMGANFLDRNRIAALSQEGHSVADISKALKIDPTCVESHVEHFKEKGHKRRGGKAKDEMEEGGTRPAPRGA